MRILILIIIIGTFESILCQQSINDITVVRVKYGGGGDWYGNKTTFINLFEQIKKSTKIKTSFKEVTYSIEDKEFYNYPVAYIAGHGNIKFNDNEVKKLRTYLTSGGFLFADDDYGMDVSFRREMKKVFPELNFVELPFNHKIYNQYYNFPNGLPKIHEHDGGPPKGLGLIFEGRLIAFYSLNTDLSDGCENAEIHNDPPIKRQQALRMTMNIILFALEN
jgi:uncharacterized protein DUF4159